MRTSPAIARAVSRGAVSVLYVPYSDRYSHSVSKGKTRVSRPFRPQAGDQLPLHGGEHRTVNGREKWVTTVTLHVDVRAIARDERGHLPLLGHPTDEEATLAGYETASEFEIAWVRHHERGWFNRQYRQLIEADVDPDDALETAGMFAAVRYRDHHADRLVWMLTVTAAYDLPILLADERGTPRTPADLPDGYVHALSEALIDEPEVLAPIKREWSEHAKARHAKARQAAPTVEPWVSRPTRGEMTLGERLDQRLAEKRAAGQSTTSDTRLIESRLAAIERDLRGLAA